MKLKKIITIVLVLFLLFQISYATVPTYVGVKILELKDDPSRSCSGYSGYGVNGRIRGLSSIVGAEYTEEFPIHFKLIDNTDSSVVWEGDSENDTDYKVGDIIKMPHQVDLTIGRDYKLSLDIDAIKVYLEFGSVSGFVKNSDGEYWTAGILGTSRENCLHTNNGVSCGAYGTNAGACTGVRFSNNRSYLNNTCLWNSPDYDCASKGFLTINQGYDSLYSADYNNLFKPNVGNINIDFTFT